MTGGEGGGGCEGGQGAMGWLSNDTSFANCTPPSSCVILQGTVADSFSILSCVPPSRGGSSGSAASSTAAAAVAAGGVATPLFSRSNKTEVAAIVGNNDKSKGNDTATTTAKASERGGGSEPPSSKISPSAPPAQSIPPLSGGASPWRWQRLEAETTGWLPGDLLSLWVRLGDLRPASYPPHVTAAGGGDGGGHSGGPRAAPAGEDTLSPSFHRKPPPRVCVRAFELTRVDDARADAITSRSRCFRGRYSERVYEKRAGLGIAARRGDGNARGVVGEEPAASRSVARSFSAAAEGVGIGVGRAGGDRATSRGSATVQLNFAVVCPMNLAAAGGSWA